MKMASYPSCVHALALESKPSPQKGPFLPASLFGGQIEGVEALIKAGCDKDAMTKDGRGFTGLMLAAGRGHLEVVQAVLNADCTKTDVQSAILMATATRHSAVANCLHNHMRVQQANDVTDSARQRSCWQGRSSRTQPASPCLRQ